MTAYSAPFVYSYNTGSGIYTFCPRMAIRANDYAIRIVGVEWFGSVFGATGAFITASAIFGKVSRYSGSSISGASSLIPTPLRDGSDPASATVRYQTAAFNPSTPSYTPGAAVSVTGSSQLVKRKPFSSDANENAWTPLMDTVINPGSTFVFDPEQPGPTGQSSAYFAYLLVTFDEEHTKRTNT